MLAVPKARRRSSSKPSCFMSLYSIHFCAEIWTSKTHLIPCAGHVSLLFFCVMDMATIDPMYQYSLSYFTHLFLRSINDSPKSKDVPTRLDSLQEHFSYFLYVNVCRSLFDRHKLLFAFKLALVQQPVPAPLLSFLLTGGTSMENSHPNPLEGIISDKSWGEVCRLADIGGQFQGLRENISSEPLPWRQ